MTSFLPTHLEIHHIQVIVRGLYELACHDGLHDAERVMLRDFYNSCQDDARALTRFDDLIAAPFDTHLLVDILDTPELKASFLQSCYFLGYADGEFSSGEREKIDEYARLLQVSTDVQHQLQDAVTDHLLQQISRIENVEALKEVANAMKP